MAAQSAATPQQQQQTPSSPLRPSSTRSTPITAHLKYDHLVKCYAEIRELDTLFDTYEPKYQHGRLHTAVCQLIRYQLETKALSLDHFLLQHGLRLSYIDPVVNHSFWKWWTCQASGHANSTLRNTAEMHAHITRLFERMTNNEREPIRRWTEVAQFYHDEHLRFNNQVMKEKKAKANVEHLRRNEQHLEKEDMVLIAATVKTELDELEREISPPPRPKRIAKRTNRGKPQHSSSSSS